VSPSKIRSLVRRYRETHLALAKWDTDLDPFVETVTGAIDAFDRRAPFDLLRFPSDSADRFIGGRREITVAHKDLDWVRLP
jgi:hypothetical protein